MDDAGDAVPDQVAVIPRMILKVRQYDETPIQLHVQTSADNPLGQGRHKEVAKVLVTQSRWACVLEIGGKIHHIESFWPSWLQVLQNTQAETLEKALRSTNTLPAEQCVNQIFERKLHVVTTDAAPSNMKAERLLCSTDKSWGLLHLVCDVHRIHRVAADVFAMVPQMTSGMIKLALSLRVGSTMSLLRAGLREHLKQNLVIKHGMRSEASTKRCKALAQLFLSKSEVQHHRKAIETLLNGDWSVSPQIEHYCNGCCATPAETLQKLYDFIAPALARSAPHVFPRHKWAGADRTLDWIGLFSVVHRLLPTLVDKLYASPDAHHDIAGEAGVAPHQDDAMAIAAGDLDWAAMIRGTCRIRVQTFQ